MPLQSRVAPDGSLHAHPGRTATLMGNRGGHIHAADKTLGRRRWASPHWIACELAFKNRQRAVWGESYTELFFLDEVTALAAGHRPCFECRRTEAKAFLAGQKVAAFDAVLHSQRLAIQRGAGQVVHSLVALPDGVMLATPTGFAALRRGRLLRWSFDGYTGLLPLHEASSAKLLTAPVITAILAAGYQPRWHATALQWDDT